ncbi:hypothetical protein RD792_005125 [Penstemon davidsonii]|uniref:peroxidase n=1 Tax=Penstemon davidsonii TaxID=160366 RepID=A0ABR0DK91_9LAMI|nr:hypothetical protein RD792_005125 [Penstemon davidsonii]
MQSRKRKPIAIVKDTLRSNSSSTNHKLSSDSENLSDIGTVSSNISATRNSRIVKSSDLGSNWRQNVEKSNKQLEGVGSLEKTFDKAKGEKTILNCASPTENTKNDAGASSCPAMARTKNIHCDLDEAGNTKSPKLWANNHHPIIRKTRYSRIESWSVLPVDYVQQQKAYFEEVDAFELPEEEGCDGSILLDDTSSFTGEKRALPNLNSVRGFDVVDNIKSAIEKVCPGVVSCADILAVASRDSVVILGGPDWNVKLGRRDARRASLTAANNSIPPPTSNLNSLISRFNSLGLSTKDMVALSGSHTIGQARCTSFRARIYNETNNLDSSLAQTRRGNCPRVAGVGDNNLAPLDLQTPTAFDNNYFRNLVNRRGLLHSDQQLFNGGSTDSIVRTYSNNANTFKSDFVAAMIKMGDIRPLTGSNGEIRKNCRRLN